MAIGPYELTASELSAAIGADRVGLPYLLFRRDDGELELRTLQEQAFVVGRSPDADLSLAWDGEVSRVHAQLERIAGRWTISDDGLSRNGTFIGQEKVGGRRVLSHGDVIRTGQTSIVYRAPSEGLDETEAASSGASAARLTPAERRVLVALCEPMLRDPGAGIASSNNEIADSLNLSVAGVKTQIRALFARLEVDDLPQNRKRAELARRAVAAGLVTERDLRDPAQE
jgi:pSer/pThr/pTyr-binding forkhead associated (FHA) protein